MLKQDIIERFNEVSFIVSDFFEEINYEFKLDKGIITYDSYIPQSIISAIENTDNIFEVVRLNKDKMTLEFEPSVSEFDLQLITNSVCDLYCCDEESLKQACSQYGGILTTLEVLESLSKDIKRIQNILYEGEDSLISIAG